VWLSEGFGGLRRVLIYIFVSQDRFQDPAASDDEIKEEKIQAINVMFIESSHTFPCYFVFLIRRVQEYRIIYIYIYIYIYLNRSLGGRTAGCQIRYFV